MRGKHTFPTWRLSTATASLLWIFAVLGSSLAEPEPKKKGGGGGLPDVCLPVCTQDPCATEEDEACGELPLCTPYTGTTTTSGQPSTTQAIQALRQLLKAGFRILPPNSPQNPAPPMVMSQQNKFYPPMGAMGAMGAMPPPMPMQMPPMPPAMQMAAMPPAMQMPPMPAQQQPPASQRQSQIIMKPGPKSGARPMPRMNNPPMAPAPRMQQYANMPPRPPSFPGGMMMAPPPAPQMGYPRSMGGYPQQRKRNADPNMGVMDTNGNGFYGKK